MKEKYVTRKKRIRQLEKQVSQLQQQVETLTNLLDSVHQMLSPHVHVWRGVCYVNLSAITRQHPLSKLNLGADYLIPQLHPALICNPTPYTRRCTSHLRRYSHALSLEVI
ncbi:hypothetical protein H6G74_00855 [Nostoc spongiaeforme FACHB-130]|uniref:BZIP domain-containing protein n=1 Tax=Nostoc spongiaeforme FACHB-130 TaxID=1357510 RepID=A0ABR8FN27_9NOSO|nr:hypothetical protein [Nostoc spongiaeforme]MBD2592875.1 hypothetical protein [Nostoc spongiaeforme FACHB-130]